MKENINGDSDLKDLVIKYLSSKYKPNYETSKDGLSQKRIYHLLDQVTKMPLKDRYLYGDLVISDLEKNFPNCKLDKAKRREFLVNVLNDWYIKNLTIGGN